MKRILGLLALVGILTFPAMALAGEQIGVYVAPKFITGWTVMDNMKTQFEEDGDSPVNMNIGDKTKGTVGGGLAIGYDFNRQFQVPVRAELEYAAFSEVKGSKSGNFGTNGSWSAKQKLQVQTLFLNAYYDFHNSTSFTPYIGAGIGMAFLNTKGSFMGDDGVDPRVSESTGSKTVTNFAWNVGAGVGYDINENFTIDLGYRFAGLGEAKTKWSTVSDGVDTENWARAKAEDIYMHQIMLALRVTF